MALFGGKRIILLSRPKSKVFSSHPLLFIVLPSISGTGHTTRSVMTQSGLNPAQKVLNTSLRREAFKMQLNLPQWLQMFKLTLPDTVIAQGAEVSSNNGQCCWEKEKKMKGRWNKLKFFCEMMKINSMPEMAPTVHTKWLCNFSVVRTTSADVAQKGMLSRPLSLPPLTTQVWKFHLQRIKEPPPSFCFSSQQTSLEIFLDVFVFNCSYSMYNLLKKYCYISKSDWKHILVSGWNHYSQAQLIPTFFKLYYNINIYVNVS